MMRLIFSSLVLAALAPLYSQEFNAASAWQSFAIADVEALHRSVLTLHPGMRDPSTPDFARRVESAYSAAKLRAEAARSFEDWTAATTKFMISFRDGHTIFRPTVIASRVRSPGFLLNKQGVRYVLRSISPAKLDGATVMSCDSVPIDSLLRTRLDLNEADWSKEPERIRQAWRLFVDSRFDGAPPLKECVIEHSGKVETLKLNWQTYNWADLAPLVAKLSRQNPVGGTSEIRKTISADGSYWIRLSSFGKEAELSALEKELGADLPSLRRARYVVFDLRGNSGGNSTWGERFASLLWGEPAVEARKRMDRSGGGKEWRASAEAAEQADETANRFAKENYPESIVNYFRGVAKLMRSAPNGDRTLVIDPCCTPEPPAAASAATPKLYGGKAYVLTDAGCFSSCVLVMNTLREMGAKQVGEPSGQNEVYGEVAGPLTTPSGLARYFIPLSIIRQDRVALGGLAPDLLFDGPMDDEKRLQEWVAGLARSKD